MMEGGGLRLTCHCGKVAVAIPERPAFANACNCTLCAKTGAWWAYLPPAQVRVAGQTHGYTRIDRQSPGVEIHFCPTCGVTTHFILTAHAIAIHGNVQMGVNMRLADEERELLGMELRYPDGRAWSGSGAFDYVAPARIIGALLR